MQIAFELPNDFVLFQSKTEIQHEARIVYSLWLYQQERVTLMKAAELAGLNLYGFMELCKTHKISIISPSKEELIEELSALNERCS